MRYVDCVELSLCCGVCQLFSSCCTVSAVAELRRGKAVKTSQILYIEVSLQDVTVNQESQGRSNFLSYVIICLCIGNKKQFKNSEYTLIVIYGPLNGIIVIFHTKDLKEWFLICRICRGCNQIIKTLFLNLPYASTVIRKSSKNICSCQSLVVFVCATED